MERLDLTITVNSPLGLKPGRLTLQCQESALAGSLNLLNQTVAVRGTQLHPGLYVFSGTLRFTGKDSDFEALCSVEKNVVNGGLLMNGQCFAISGIASSLPTSDSACCSVGL